MPLAYSNQPTTLTLALLSLPSRCRCRGTPLDPCSLSLAMQASQLSQVGSRDAKRVREWYCHRRPAVGTFLDDC